jgi:hypothetical protein
MKIAKNLLLFVLIITLSNCYSQKNNKTEKSYIFTKYKSKDKNSWYLNLETFEYENRTKRFYSVYHINNVIFSDHDLKPLNPSVIRGEFKINAGAVHKEWIKVPKFVLQKGDSINIRFYLKDSNEVYSHPLVKQNKK